jgi:hypothetical protein
MFYVFAILFYTWGIIGGIFTQFMFALKQSTPGLIGFPSVEESSYQTATATIWIGGMCFFAFAAILVAMNRARADVEIIRRKTESEHRPHPAVVDAEQPWRSA